MIVYNVQRRWFTMKNDADTYRRTEGLPPAALATLRIDTRDELAALLNGLCGLQPDHTAMIVIDKIAEPAVITRAQITDEIPDCVPLFLRKESEARAKRA